MLPPWVYLCTHLIPVGLCYVVYALQSYPNV